MGGHSSLYPFKRGAMVVEEHFYHRFRNRQIFGVAKDFCPNFPKLPRKGFCATFAYKFSPTKIITTIVDVTSNKNVFFCKPWAPFFEVK